MSTCCLRMENITKQFGDFKANDDVSMYLNKGEVLGILGENGAGKSTLMNVLCGLYHPTAGSIYIDNEECKMNSAADSVDFGIGVVHQHFMLIEKLTVFQNIILGMDASKGYFIREDDLKKEIKDLSEKYGLQIDLDAQVSKISVGAQQRVEIIKTLWRGAEILVLDEPTAVLTDEEVAGLFDIIRKLTGEGKSVLFISHKLREIMEICDRTIVLRLGKLVGEFKPSETSEQELANAMVGKVQAKSTYKRKLSEEQPIMSLNEVSYQKASKHHGINNMTIHIRPGEILGIGGVDGNGQSELARLLTGTLTPEEGSITFKSEPIDKYSSKYFIDRSISHIPEDRDSMGLIGDFDLRENLILKNDINSVSGETKGWTLNLSEIKDHAEKMVEEYDIRCRSVFQKVGKLSGGNRQKVILARELDREPKILVAVYPTRGLDVGAANYIHDRIVAARDDGCAVVLFSTDVAEILKLADKLVVLYEGEIMYQSDYQNLDLDALSMAMAGKTY